MKQSNKILEVLKKHIYIPIILLVVILIFVPYISKNFVYGDDYLCHVANIFAISEKLSLKHPYISKIRSTIANNLGYGNGIFYPQLVYHSIAYIYFFMGKIGFSMISAIKVFEFGVVFLAAIAMYQFMQKTFESKRASLVASILYVSAPYLMSDIFRRMALAELAIFLFVPIIMLSITELFKENHKKFAIYFIIGYVGMILSHLVLTVYFTILLVIFLLLNIKKVFNKKTIIYFAISTLIVLAITSSFWGPLLEHKLFGSYVVFGDNAMASLDSIKVHQLSWSSLVLPGFKYMTVHIAPIALILLILGLLGNTKFMKNFDGIQKSMLMGIFVMSVISFIFTLDFINWEYIPKMFWLIQFPWRMCAFLDFGVAIIAGLATTLIKKDTLLTNFVILLIITSLSIFEANRVINTNQLIDVPDVEADAVGDLFDRGVGGNFEYLPNNAFLNLFYLEEKGQNINFFAGAENIEDFAVIANDTPFLQFAIKLKDGTKTTAEIPRLFYLGYTIEITGDNGKVEKLKYNNSTFGLIDFEIPYSGNIKISYTGTTFNKICNITSALTIIGLVITFVIDKTHIKPVKKSQKMLDETSEKETVSSNN